LAPFLKFCLKQIVKENYRCHEECQAALNQYKLPKRKWLDIEKGGWWDFCGGH
jgi:hypothetical protein